MAKHQKPDALVRGSTKHWQNLYGENVGRVFAANGFEASNVKVSPERPKLDRSRADVKQRRQTPSDCRSLFSLFSDLSFFDTIRP